MDRLSRNGGKGCDHVRSAAGTGAGLAERQGQPAPAVKWQPHKAFMSCDGKTGVTTGARGNGPMAAAAILPPSGSLFRRMNAATGEWKWVVDHGDFAAARAARAEK